MFSELFEHAHFAYIFVAAVLFIAGIYFAPSIVDRNIRWLLVYPRWMAKLMEKYFSDHLGFFPLFITIFLLNNLSLFTGFLSGFLVILPLVLAFFTGFNVAVIGYDLMGWQGLWHMLVNPVAWLEFPAAWISFSLGIRLATEIIVQQNFHSAVKLFPVLLPVYFKYVFSLLLIAALLESVLISIARQHKDES